MQSMEKRAKATAGGNTLPLPLPINAPRNEHHFAGRARLEESREPKRLLRDDLDDHLLTLILRRRILYLYKSFSLRRIFLFQARNHPLCVMANIRALHPAESRANSRNLGDSFVYRTISRNTTQQKCKQGRCARY